MRWHHGPNPFFNIAEWSEHVACQYHLDCNRILPTEISEQYDRWVSHCWREQELVERAELDEWHVELDDEFYEGTIGWLPLLLHDIEGLYPEDEDGHHTSPHLSPAQSDELFCMIEQLLAEHLPEDM